MNFAAKLSIFGLTVLASVLLVGELASIFAIATDTGSLYLDAARMDHLFCHQLPSRCPWFGGMPTVLCFRCIGLYSGILAGPITWPRARRIPNRALLLGAFGFLPSIVELLLDHFIDPGQSAVLRWASGVTLGFGCIALFLLLAEGGTVVPATGRAR